MQTIFRALLISTFVAFSTLTTPFTAFAAETSETQDTQTPVLEMENEEASSQSNLTGTGEAAGEAAGQTASSGGGLLSPGILVGVLAVAAITAVALEISTDDDQLATTTSSGT